MPIRNNFWHFYITAQMIQNISFLYHALILNNNYHNILYISWVKNIVKMGYHKTQNEPKLIVTQI